LIPLYNQKFETFQHFGGPTHCVVFGPEVKLEFNEEAIPKPVEVEQYQGLVRVCSLLAIVVGQSRVFDFVCRKFGVLRNGFTFWTDGI
jgi:hypothetical protein